MHQRHIRPHLTISHHIPPRFMMFLKGLLVATAHSEIPHACWQSVTFAHNFNA